MAHADVLDDRILVQAHWNENELVKRIPGARWKAEAKAWTVPLSWAACLQLRGVFRETLSVGQDLVNWAKRERETRVDPSLRLRSLVDVDHQDETDQLYPFQRAGVDWLLVAGSALLGDDVGTGKTIQALELLRVLELSGERALPALVVCPNGVKFNWAAEAARWAPHVRPYVIRGSAAARKKLIAEAKDDPSALLIINFESLRMHTRTAGFGSIRLKRCLECGGKDPKLKATQCEVHARDLNHVPFRTIIIDECHRLKDVHAKQTRAAWAISLQETVTRRIGMTGTVIANDPSDLWSIMHFISPDEYPTKSAYVDRYCLLSWGAYGGLDVKGLNPDTRAEFYALLDPRFRRTPKALVLHQLPPKTFVKRFVELTPKQAKAYAEITAGATRLPDGSIMIAPNDLELQTRLTQFASATMEQVGVDEQTGKPKFRMCDPSSKVDELEELLEELGDKPVAVAAEHRQLIDLAAKRLDKLGVSYGRITGAERDFERDVALRDFQAGKLRVMLFTLAAGGTGLTMTATDTLVRLQRSWSMLLNVQTVGRIDRIGAERHDGLLIIDVVARGTVEERQLERLYEKAERLEEINRDRARLAAAGLSFGELDDEEKKILNSDLGDS